MIKLFWAGLLAVAVRVVMAQPVDLLTVYEQAQHSDPSFLKAKATWLAAKEALPQAQAKLLPNLGAVGTLTGSRQNVTGQPGKGNNNKQVTVNLTQPLFNYSAWYGVRSVRSQVQQARMAYELAKQELVTRVVSVYFDLLLAQDKLRFKQAQSKATSRQLEQANQRYSVGLMTKTEVFQARAGHDRLNAEVIAARNEILIQKEALRQITGVYYDELNLLRDDMDYKMPAPNDIKQWVSVAQKGNLAIQAARFAMQAAKDQIKQAFGGHLPALDLIGQYDDQETQFANIPVNQSTRSIGLKLTLPIFEGWSINSKVRQARHLYQQAQDELQLSLRGAEFNIRKNYNQIEAQISQIKADRQAVKSSKSSVKSTEDGYRSGTQTIFDVLQSQQILFEVLANIAKDQYDFIKSLVSLKYAAGGLSERDIRLINTWLAPPPTATV